MSWRASGYVKGLTHGPRGDKLTRSEKFLLLIIADYYNDDRNAAWPSIKSLSENALMSDQTVKRLRQSLINKGLLEYEAQPRDNGSFGSSRYTIGGLGDSDPVPLHSYGGVARTGLYAEPPMNINYSKKGNGIKDNRPSSVIALEELREHQSTMVTPASERLRE